MTSEQLLSAMGELGVRVVLQGGQPRLVGPKVPAVLIAVAKFHRDALLAKAEPEPMPEPTAEDEAIRSAFMPDAIAAIYTYEHWKKRNGR